MTSAADAPDPRAIRILRPCDPIPLVLSVWALVPSGWDDGVLEVQCPTCAKGLDPSTFVAVGEARAAELGRVCFVCGAKPPQEAA